jgi:hypothetical protein
MNGSVLQQIIDVGLKQLDTSQLAPRQWQVIHHLQDCRTQAMGSYQWHCDHCGQDTQWYCSCRDRHCPMCQGKARDKWSSKRQADVLPVSYHHLVVALPHQFNGWASIYPDILYKVLFQCVWQTLSEFATTRHHLDGKLGMLAVLHTWGQTLCQHIHLHCLIPGGVLTRDKTWCAARHEGYLFPVKALSAKFKGKMLAALEQESIKGSLARIPADSVRQVLNETARLKWNVYSKPTLTHTKSVVSYLARYCNRVGISDSRLLFSEDQQVHMRYKDYRTNQSSWLNLSPGELLRRFVLHILPKGFMRLRYYGFMANAIRRKSLSMIRTSLGDIAKVVKSEVEESEGPECPNCHHVGMVLMGIKLPERPVLVHRTR